MAKETCPKCGSSASYHVMVVPAYMPNSGRYTRCDSCETSLSEKPDPKHKRIIKRPQGSGLIKKGKKK